MAKYSAEFKCKVVQEYLNGHIGYTALTKKYDIPSLKCIQEWVGKYRRMGKDGLQRSRKNETYSFQFKVNAVELYLSTEISYQKLVIKLPKATYMYWQQRFDRQNPDAELEAKIKAIRQSDRDFGYRRIWGKLRKEGLLVNRKKVQRLVQKLGLQVKAFSHKSRKYSSYKGTVGRIAPNRLRRRFDTCIPHQKITTDTTEFKYYEMDTNGNILTRKAYLDPFLDLYNREIISFSITKRPSSQGIMSALDKAIAITSDCPYRRTFHSNQGWAYQMGSYVGRLKEERIFQSMSRKGTCLDNSVMENFFGLLKQEIYYGHTYHSFEELERAIRHYITYYNKHRIKAKLEWLSPVDYRLRHAVA